MNEDEYIVTDLFKDITAAINENLTLDKPLRFDFGYIEEINATLQEMSKNAADVVDKFPLLYLVTPFTIQYGVEASGGETVLNLFIIAESERTMKANARVESVYKPLIYPIYRELLDVINHHIAFLVPGLGRIPHKRTDFYYWTQDKKSVLNDVVDSMAISEMKLSIKPVC